MGIIIGTPIRQFKAINENMNEAPGTGTAPRHKAVLLGTAPIRLKMLKSYHQDSRSLQDSSNSQGREPREEQLIREGPARDICREEHSFATHSDLVVHGICHGSYDLEPEPPS